MSRDKEVFKWKELSIYQQDDVFKIGTDAILLGAWIPTVIPSANRVLDVGTGTGILALMMQRSFPGAEVTSIDNNENAVHLARQNFQLTNAGSLITVTHGSIFDFRSEEKSFDLIVSNPPYYFEHLVSQKELMRSSKHSGVPIKKWMESFYHLLTRDGNVCLVIPYESTNDWIKAANEFGLYVKERMDVYSFKNDDRPSRSLIHLQGVLVKPNCNQLHIYNTANQYTEEYIAFSGINPERK